MTIESKAIRRTVQEIVAITCDRCRRRVEVDRDDACELGEWWRMERLGGYASVFGDGAIIQVDLCQQCVKSTLGDWLRITPPAP